MENKLPSLNIETIVETVTKNLLTLGVTFKVETYMSNEEDTEFSPGDEEDIDVSDLIYDESENDIWNCQLTFPIERRKEFESSLRIEFGEPSEMRGSGDTDPMWKFGRDGHGQLWVYDYNKERTYIDIRYYYTKM